MGFALESFNPIGGYREHYRSSLNPSAPKVERKVRAKSVQYRVGPEVDSSGEFSDGKSFDDIHGFMMGLAENEKLLARAFVRKLLTFATGRELGFSDREDVERIVSQCSGGGYRAGDLFARGHIIEYLSIKVITMTHISTNRALSRRSILKEVELPLPSLFLMR